MPVTYIPYHLDEHLPSLFPPDIETLTVELPESDTWTRMAALYGGVADAAPRTVVSGDCTISIGMTAGLQRAGIDPSIVWIDGHGDLQSLETTESGYLGGMALRVLLGYRPDLIAERIGLRPPAPDRVLLAGARALDPAELDYIATAGVRTSTLDALTAEAVPSGPLLMQVDLDVHDPSVIPGIRYPAPDGPDAAAVLRAVQVVLDTGRVAAFHIACTWEAGTADPSGVRQEVISALLSSWDSASAGN